MLAANTLNSADACHNDSFHLFLTTLELLQFISNSSDHLTLLLSLCLYITLFFLSCKIVKIKVKRRTKEGLINCEVIGFPSIPTKMVSLQIYVICMFLTIFNT